MGCIACKLSLPDVACKDQFRHLLIIFVPFNTPTCTHCRPLSPEEQSRMVMAIVSTRKLSFPLLFFSLLLFPISISICPIPGCSYGYAVYCPTIHSHRVWVRNDNLLHIYSQENSSSREQTQTSLFTFVPHILD